MQEKSQVIALTCFEISQSRLSLMSMLKQHGVPMLWSFTEGHRFDFSKIKKVTSWEEHDDTMYFKIEWR